MWGEGGGARPATGSIYRDKHDNLTAHTKCALRPPVCRVSEIHTGLLLLATVLHCCITPQVRTATTYRCVRANPFERTGGDAAPAAHNNNKT